jgi:hypothetical protein
MADLVRYDATASRVWDQELGRGAIAGLAGGVIMGVLMGTMGMLPMVASLVRSDNAVVGFIVHMVISAAIGVIYGAAVGNLPLVREFGPAAVAGAIYGVIWWILGPLVIMPLLLGMGLQVGMAFSPPMLMSLMGHILYGLVTTLAFAALARRA